MISCKLPISIHAPAWGATNRANAQFPVIIISIHAPAWGATELGQADFRWRQNFNPRTRVGCDIMDLAAAIASAPISIHAPAWGATVGRAMITVSTKDFNPRIRVGCDPMGVRTFHTAYKISIHAPAWGATRSHALRPQGRARFQSTHPRGVRPACPVTTIQSPYFNPRTRVGCDGDAGIGKTKAAQFQSTHPRGVRLIQIGKISVGSPNFNPRTRMGCDW